jgi:hypothetical protein
MTMFSFPVSADEPVDFSYEPAVVNIILNLTELPALIYEYKNYKDIIVNYMDNNKEERFIEKCEKKIEEIIDLGYILMPNFLDMEKADEDHYRFSFDISRKMYGLVGYVGDEETKFSISCFKKDGKDSYSWRTDPNFLKLEKELGKIYVAASYDISAKKSYLWSEVNAERKTVISQQFYVYANDYIYWITISGNIPFDEIWNDLSFKPYPLENGFFEMDGDLYYGENGELLSGWYKIHNNLYYFDENGIAAKGEYTLGEYIYKFDENGVYLGTATSD